MNWEKTLLCFTKGLFLAGAIAFLNGCGTISAPREREILQNNRPDDNILPPVYAATSYDGILIFKTLTGDTFYQCYGPGVHGTKYPIRCIGVGCILLPIFLIDLPISLVTDTCRLPYDVYLICYPPEKVKKDEKVEETSPPTQ